MASRAPSRADIEIPAEFSPDYKGMSVMKRLVKRVPWLLLIATIIMLGLSMASLLNDAWRVSDPRLDALESRLLNAEKRIAALEDAAAKSSKSAGTTSKKSATPKSQEFGREEVGPMKYR